MAQKATPESFEVELNRLATKFERSFAEVTRPEYPEARLRRTSSIRFSEHSAGTWRTTRA